MPTFKKNDAVIVDTGRKTNSGAGIVTKFDADADMVSVKIGEKIVTVDADNVKLAKKTAPATKAAAKTPAAKTPAAKKTPAKAAAPEFDVGDSVTFDNDGDDVTGTIVKIFPSGNVKVKLEDGEIVKTELSELTAAEDGDSDDDNSSEDEPKFEVGSAVSWDDDDDTLFGTITKINPRAGKITVEEDDTEEVHTFTDFDDLTLVVDEDEAPAPKKRGAKTAAAKKTPAKAAPAKRAAKKAEPEDAGNEPKDVLAEIIVAVEEHLEAFCDKPGQRAADKIVKAVQAALAERF